MTDLAPMETPASQDDGVPLTALLKPVNSAQLLAALAPWVSPSGEGFLSETPTPRCRFGCGHRG